MHTTPTSSPAPAPGDEPLQALAAASARLGADTGLIQGAGGNTSVKLEGLLWVKASGLWLRDALQRPMFVPVTLARVRDGVAAGEADPVAPALRAELAAPGQRASIETTLHALMVHRVVLHVHAVDALAWAVRPDGEQAVAPRLDGLAWAWVPYARPGLPLTRQVAAVLAREPADVLLLANHGLVVGGASVAEAEARLHEVVERLAVPARPAPAGDTARLKALGEGLGWRLPSSPRVHAIATDALNLRRAQAGVLYPDHVVFLGAALCVSEADEAPARSRERLAAWRALGPDAPPCVAVPGAGLLVREDLSEAAEEMLACWADVLVRLPAAPEPATLPQDEAEGLAHWDAEKFRRSLGR